MEDKKLTTKEILMTIASVFLLISMLVYFSRNAFVAVLMGILGILLLPSVNRKINEKIIKENKIKNGIKIALEIIMFIFIVYNVPTTENVGENNQVAKENVSNNTKIENVLNTTNNATANNITAKAIVANTSIEENATNTSSQASTKTEVTENKNGTENKKDVEEKTQTASSSSSTSSKPSSTSKSTSSSSSGSTSKQSSSSSASSSTTNSQTVYVTPTGKRYHLSPTCGGKNSKATTLSNAKSMGLTPCKKCAQ